MKLLLLAVPMLFLAHGDAEWIMRNPKYKWENGITHCCGPADCERIAKSEVKVTSDGFIVRGKLFIWDNPALYQSENEDWWVCETRGEPTCLFNPEGTT